MDMSRKRLSIHALPEQEKEHARFVQHNLFYLENMIDSLSSSIKLYQWASNNAREQKDRSDASLLFAWSLIGARAGALYIYGFHKSSHELNGQLSKCPSLFPLMDRQKFGASMKKFDENFPNFALVRLAAAHPAELYNTPKKVKGHAFNSGIDTESIKIEEGASTIIDGSILEGEFTSTVEGKVVKYLISDVTVNRLQESMDLIWEALDPVIEYSHEMLRKMQEEEDR